MSPTVPIPVSLAELLRPYPGEWVTLSHDEKKVIGHGASLEEALQQAMEHGEERPILIKAPDKNAAFLL